MLQTLLADSLELALHRETRNLTRYALMAGWNGPNCQSSKADETTGLHQRVNAAGESSPLNAPESGPSGRSFSVGLGQVDQFDIGVVPQTVENNFLTARSDIERSGLEPVEV